MSAFALDSENDGCLAAKLCDKKLDRDMGNIDVNKAKIALLSQCEAGEIERKRNEYQLTLQCDAAKNECRREENQLQILQLQLQIQQGQPAVGSAIARLDQQFNFGAGNNFPQDALFSGNLNAFGHGN